MKHDNVAERPKLAYTPAEAGDLIGSCVSRVFKLIRAGELDSFKNGKSRRITHRAIEDYLARQEAAARKARKVAA